jgi:hypothetical protein
MVVMVITVCLAISHSPYFSGEKGPPYVADTVLFSWSGFGSIFSVAVFSQLAHHSVPILCQPVRNKRDITKILFAGLLTTFLGYTLIGVITTLYFGRGVQEVVTLNWLNYTGGPDKTAPVWAQIIKYSVILFPVVVVTSAYPLVTITLGNSLQSGFFNSQTKKVKIACRLIAAIPPFAAAIGLRTLGTIVSFAGMLGFFIAFIIPAGLQLRSRQLCRQKWGDKAVDTPYSSHFSKEAYSYAMLIFGVAAFFYSLVYNIMSLV